MPNDLEPVKLIECPRDAWQGLAEIIPTEAKMAYLRMLIEAGFRHLDAVSFVSPKYVPQMADSEAVLQRLATAGLIRSSGVNGRDSKERVGNDQEVEIIGVVVNAQGLSRALAAPGVSVIGYPYSVSAHFRRQNAHMSQSESRSLVTTIDRAAQAAGKKLVVYISMAFGNPFGEPWSPEVTADALEWLQSTGVTTVSLADTAGVASAEEIGRLVRQVIDSPGKIDVGVHLHSRPEQAADKVLAAYEAGCRRFEGALTGLGGCPFAGDELVGNIPTEAIVATLGSRGVSTGVAPLAVLAAVDATAEFRKQYAGSSQKS